MTHLRFVIAAEEVISQPSHRYPKYCLSTVGYPGFGQTLNATCGLADASTSTEIRNENTCRPSSTPNPRGQVQITVNPRWLNQQPLLHKARKNIFHHQLVTFHFTLHSQTKDTRLVWFKSATTLKSVRLNCPWKVIYHLLYVCSKKHAVLCSVI